MILGSHVILSAYGFWLPNDPRGSWSKFVGSWELSRLGRATKVNSRESVAARAHDRRHRLSAKGALQRPPVRFDGRQARAIGRGFAALAARSRLTLWACAILPEHVHLVLAPHGYDVAQAANLLKGQATRQLRAENLHPTAMAAGPGQRPPSVWARGLWKVYLFRPEDVRRAIRYVEANPMREGLPLQRWSFVTRYEG